MAPRVQYKLTLVLPENAANALRAYVYSRGPFDVYDLETFWVDAVAILDLNDLPRIAELLHEEYPMAHRIDVEGIRQTLIAEWK